MRTSQSPMRSSFIYNNARNAVTRRLEGHQIPKRNDQSQERKSKSRTRGEFHFPVVGDFYEKQKLEQSTISGFREQRSYNRTRKNYFDEISSLTKSKLGELLLTVAEEELLIEKQRQQLASLREFEPYSSFTRIDRDHKGFITAYDIGRFIL